MFLIEDKNFLTEKQKDHIDNVVLESSFPWFFHNVSVLPNKLSKVKNNKSYLSHIVLRRPDQRPKGEEFNSTESVFCVDVLKTFCEKHNIKCKEILRISYNLTFNNGYSKGDLHVDHDYPHNQLIVYLNDCDKKLYTVIKDNKKEIKIKPEKFKGVCFESKPHYQLFPKKQERVILVITFR